MNKEKEIIKALKKRGYSKLYYNLDKIFFISQMEVMNYTEKKEEVCHATWRHRIANPYNPISYILLLPMVVGGLLEGGLEGAKEVSKVFFKWSINSDYVKIK